MSHEVETVAEINPKNSFPKKGTYGSWLTHGKGDVHVYVNSHGAVIGTNVNYKDKVNHSDLALIFEEGGVRLQYTDEKGNPQNLDLDLACVKGALLGLLTSLKVMHEADAHKH